MMRANRDYTDLELIEAYYKQDDTGYLGELFNRYTHLAYGVCLKYLKDRDAAKDSMMEVFERLLAKPPTADIKNIKTWLFVVVKNHCLMKLRKNDPKVISIHSENTFMEIADEVHPLDKENQIDGLNQCIDKLNNEQKACIEMFYLKKKCYQEIVSKTGYEMKKVKSYIQNGKRNLKICLEKLNVGPQSTY